MKKQYQLDIYSRIEVNHNRMSKRFLLKQTNPTNRNKLTLANHCQLKDIKGMIHTLRTITPASIGVGIDCREVYYCIGTLQCLSQGCTLLISWIAKIAWQDDDIIFVIVWQWIALGVAIDEVGMFYEYDFVGARFGRRRRRRRR